MMQLVIFWWLIQRNAAIFGAHQRLINGTKLPCGASYIVFVIDMHPQ